jgi:hypothetical protein
MGVSETRLPKGLRAGVVALLLCAGVLQAQSIVGRISGTVTDPTGAVIPNASVSITAESTKMVRAVKTDDNGFYVATALPVGAYTVSVEFQGFKKSAKTGANLVADGRLTVDFALEVGDTASSVQVVEAVAEAVNTVSGEVGRVIDTQQVQNLALNGRNYMQLVSLVPGVALLDEDQMALTTSLSITAQSVNGNRGNTNYLSIDGGSNMDSGSNGSQVNNVGVDFIREVNIKSSNFSAEFGRNSGASINVVTRGGGDQFHGGVFEFFRNDKLDARNFFAPTKGAFRYNDFGWNLGGPIKRGKVFFFAGQEYKKIRKFTDPVRRTLPTRAERAGDFSARTGTLNLPGTTTPIEDRNVASMITADGRAIANAYTAMEKMAAWYSDTPTGNNAIFQVSNPFGWRQDIARVDYSMSDKSSIFFRYLHDMYDLVEPYGTFFSSNLPMTPTKRLRPGYGLQLTHTWVASPTLVNEAKINSSWNGQRIPMVGDAWKRSTYGFQFPQLYSGGWYDADGIPEIDVNGFSNLRGPRNAMMSPTTDIQLMESMTFIRARHTAKVGITYIRNRKDQNGRPEYAGYVNFNQSGNNRTTGLAFADALLGNFRTYREASADPVGFFRFSSLEGFVTDSFKVHRKLSLEFGVRWQRNLPTYTQANNITNFVPALYDKSKAVSVTPGGLIVPGSGNIYNGLVRAGDGVPEEEMGRMIGLNVAALNLIPSGAPRGLYEPQLLFAPRFSFAFSPTSDGKTAFRGGFGMFYDKPEGNLIFSMVNYAPWLNSANFENGNLGAPSGGTAAALAPMGNIDAIDPNLKTPYTMNFSFGIQRELPKGAFLEVSYVGNLGRRLLRQPDINRVSFDALRERAALPSAQRPSENSMRPYLGYSSIRQRMTDSSSNYHSLQTYLTRRTRGRFLFTGSYTWSKALTDANGNGDNPENWQDRHYSYGPASFDRSHIFALTYTYMIPMPRFSNVVARQALAGWEISGINRAQTGAPLTMSANTSIGGRRADYLGGPVLLPADERGPNGYLNPAAFGPAPEDKLGNSGVGIARAPGLLTTDGSLRKAFAFGEGSQKRIQFQADFFNFINRTNFRGPNTNRSDGNGLFGTIATAGPPRMIQLALKFNF